MLVANELARIYAEFRQSRSATAPDGVDAPGCKGPYLRPVNIKVHKNAPSQSVYEVEQLDDEMLDFHLMDDDMDNDDMEDEVRISYLVPFICRTNCRDACCKYDDDEIDEIERLVDAPPPSLLWWKDEENHPTTCPFCRKVLFLKGGDTRVTRIPDSQTANDGTDDSDHASADREDGHSIQSHDDRSSHSRNEYLNSSDEHRNSDSSGESDPSL